MARAVFASLHTLRPPVAPNIPCKSKVVYLSFLGTLFIWGGLCAIGFPIQSGPFFGPKLPNWPTQTPGTLTDQGQLASLWARSHQLASPAPATRSRQLVSPWPFPQTLSVCPRILRALRLCVGLGDTPNPARSGRVAKWPCGPCPRPHQLASPCGPGSTPTGQSTPWPVRGRSPGPCPFASIFSRGGGPVWACAISKHQPNWTRLEKVAGSAVQGHQTQLASCPDRGHTTRPVGRRPLQAPGAAGAPDGEV